MSTAVRPSWILPAALIALATTACGPDAVAVVADESNAIRAVDENGSPTATTVPTDPASPAPTPSPSPAEDDPDDSPVPTPPSDLEFAPCPGGDCATVPVPIDPDQPGLGTIDIEIQVLRSADPETRRGYLLVNPGGPGASGIEFAQAFPFFAPGELLDAFDIVGFDPRGVAASEPELGCGGRDVVRAQTDQVSGLVDTADEIAAMEELVARCSEATGPAAPYLGTEFVAHDMDAIRAALGADRISYYGASYGSSIGVFYASLYPDRVRAMVVDGADNPLDQVATQEQRIDAGLEQARGFEELLERALESCVDSSCPIHNDGDPIGYYLDAVEKIGLVNDARPDLPDAGLAGIASTLYSESDWPNLHRGLSELLEDDDPRILAAFSDFQASDSDIRELDWILCLDDWSLFPEVDRATALDDAAAFERAFAEQTPLLAAASTEDDLTGFCPFLDTIAPEPLDVALDGGDVPILVIGNRSDPATPFAESVELVEDTLSNGYLLDTDHPDHVVYPRDNDCVHDIVHDVLIDRRLPDERAVVCERE